MFALPRPRPRHRQRVRVFISVCRFSTPTAYNRPSFQPQPNPSVRLLPVCNWNLWLHTIQALLFSTTICVAVCVCASSFSHYIGIVLPLMWLLLLLLLLFYSCPVFIFHKFKLKNFPIRFPLFHSFSFFPLFDFIKVNVTFSMRFIFIWMSLICLCYN